MEDEASSQLENHCIVVPARNTPEHLGLNAKRMELVSERIANHDSLSSPSADLLWHKTCDVIPTKHAIHHFPNFQQPIRGWASSK